MRALGLLLVNFWTLLEVWALSLRRTLSFKSLLLFLLIGFYGTTLVTFFLHFLSTRFFPATLVSYTLNPAVEEVMKISPLILVLWLCRSAVKKMAASDFLLLGLAAGTGFEIGEALLYAMGGTPRTYAATLWLPQQQFDLSYYFHQFNQILTFGFAGHGILAAAIGAAIGFVLLFYRPKYTRWLLALPMVVLAWAIYDHIMVNYLLGNSSLGSVNIHLNRFAETLYYFDRAGKLIVYALSISVFLGIFFEEWVLSKAIANDSSLRLSGEKKGYALATEFELIWGNYSKGWKYLRQLFRIFLLRRQIAFYRYRLKSGSSQTPEQSQAPETSLVTAFQTQIQVLQTLGANPEIDAWDPKKLLREFQRTIISKFKVLSIQAYFTALMILAWMLIFVFPSYGWRNTIWFRNTIMFLAAFGVIQAVITYLRFFRLPKPAYQDANVGVQFFSAKILLNLSLVLSILGVAAYFMPLAKIINNWHTYFLWNAFKDFYNHWGAYLPGMLGINAGLLSSLAGTIISGLSPSSSGAKATAPAGTNNPVAQPLPGPTPFVTPTPPGLAAVNAYQNAINDSLSHPTVPEKIRDDGTKVPHCNFFVADVATKLGINELSDMDADGQYNYVAQSSNWQKVTPEEAQSLANTGNLAIGVAPKDESGSGHSTVVAPGHTIEDSGMGKVPWVYDINRKVPNEANKASKSYFKSNPPTWYAYVKK